MWKKCSTLWVMILNILWLNIHPKSTQLGQNLAQWLFISCCKNSGFINYMNYDFASNFPKYIIC
jgi:hypothetical protein